MKVGAVYLLAGGHVLRYQGPWGKDNHAPITGNGLAFRLPSEPVESPAVGYSAGRGEVTRELTASDIPWLLEREAAEKARNLPWRETRLVIEELERGS